MRETQKVKYSVLVGLVITNDSDFLLTQRSFKSSFLPGNWGVPAGNIEPGESVEDAIYREMSEETGLTGSIVQILGTSTFLGAKDDVFLHNIQINYLVRADNRNVVLDLSSEAFRWVSQSKYHETMLDHMNTEVLKQAFASAGR